MSSDDEEDAAEANGDEDGIVSVTYRDIIVEHGGDAIWRVTLNRPAKLNAITDRMWDELGHVFQDIALDEHARCVVLTGAGRGFCSGRDLDEEVIAGQEPLDAGAFRDLQRSLVPFIVRCPAPVIAAVNGPAVGAGLSLALCCDIRIASDEARFMVAFLRRGLVPDAGATFLLARAAGYAKAMELCLLDEMIDAQQAHEIGLVNRVVPHASLESEVGAVVARISALPLPVVRMSKGLLAEAVVLGLEVALDHESQAQPLASAAAGHLDRVADFLEQEGRSRT